MFALALAQLAFTDIMPTRYFGAQKPDCAINSAGTKNQGRHKSEALKRAQPVSWASSRRLGQ